MTQLVLIMAAFAALSAIGEMLAAIITFFVKLVTMIVVTGLLGIVLIVAAAIASHGRVI